MRRRNRVRVEIKYLAKDDMCTMTTSERRSPAGSFLLQFLLLLRLSFKAGVNLKNRAFSQKFSHVGFNFKP